MASKRPLHTPPWRRKREEREEYSCLEVATARLEADLAYFTDSQEMSLTNCTSQLLYLHLSSSLPLSPSSSGRGQPQSFPIRVIILRTNSSLGLGINMVQFGLGKALKPSVLCNYKKAEAMHFRANFTQEIIQTLAHFPTAHSIERGRTQMLSCRWSDSQSVSSN